MPPEPDSLSTKDHPPSIYPPLSPDFSAPDPPISAQPACLTNPVFARRLRDKPLDPGDAADLEEEAAKYHNPDWPPVASAPPLEFGGPPPYPPRVCAPALLPPTFPSAVIHEAKDALTSQVSDLRQVLDLQKEFAKLSTELASLQTSLRETVLSPAVPLPVPAQPAASNTGSRSRQNRKRIFPLTRSQTASGQHSSTPGPQPSSSTPAVTNPASPSVHDFPDLPPPFRTLGGQGTGACLVLRQ